MRFWKAGVIIRSFWRRSIVSAIGIKGLSTLFVPDDDAFEAYFTKHAISNGLDGIDSVDLSLLIGQHIMRFAYRRQELTNFQPTTGMEDLPGVNYKHPT